MRFWEPKQRVLAVVLFSCLLMGGCFQSAFAQSADLPTQAAPGPMSTTSVSNDEEGYSAVVSYPGLTMKASFGYDGAITYLRQMPLRISLKNEGADFSGTLAMNVYRNDLEYDRYELPVSVASGAVIQVEMSVQLTMAQKEYSLELMIQDECAAIYPISPTRVINPETLLVGTLSENSQSLSHFYITTNKDPLKRGDLWQAVSLSKDTFPNDLKTMETFAFLAIDGVDARDLTAQQQATLDRWLNNGGIVILGGAAQAGSGYPYFEKYTGIAAGTPHTSADVTPLLLSYLKSAEEPLGQEMMLTEMKGAKHVVAGEEVPLLDVTPVGKGFVMTASFSLSDKPLNTWQGTTVLWQRVMLAAAGSHYQQIVEQQKNYYNRANSYYNTNTMNHIEIPNDRGFVLPMVLLVIFVAMVGFGSYWVLKKKDRREWLWITIPSFSILFALALMLLSQWTSLKEPIVVISDFVFQNSDGVITETAGISAAMDSQAPMTLAVKDGEIVVAENSNNYYSTEDGTPRQPTRLRYTYQLGNQPGLVFPATSAWGVNSMIARGTNPPQINVEGSCWFDEDGLHINLTNRGEYMLEKGKVLTSYGYLSVDALLPGQSADYLLQKSDESSKAPTTNGNGNYPIIDGMMVAKAQQSTLDYYSVYNAIIFPEMYTSSQTSFYPTTRDYEERAFLTSLYDQIYSLWEYNSEERFYYVTFNDSICNIGVTLNGKTVKRTAQANIVNVELKYIPVSESGFVKYGSGSIPVYIAERADDNTLSRGVAITERYRYFRLSDKPTFCFELPDTVQSIKIADMSILPSNVYGDYGLRILNIKTRQWDEINLASDLKEQMDFSLYVNEENELYVQFVPGAATESYVEMNTPNMMFEGRIQ